MDFREFSKAYNDYLMHAGDRDFNWNNEARRNQNESQNDRKKHNKEVNFLKNYIVNNNVLGGLKDYEEFYNKCSLADWRKAVEYAQQGNKTGVQSLLVKYTLGNPVTVTGTSLVTPVNYNKRRR